MKINVQRFTLACLKGAFLCSAIGAVAAAAIGYFDPLYGKHHVPALARAVAIAGIVGAVAGAAKAILGDDVSILRVLVWVGGFGVVGAFLGAANQPHHDDINALPALAGAVLGGAVYVVKHRSRRGVSTGH